jgi:ABC-type multidrug transport system fused ATPase/permease subunit
MGPSALAYQRARRLLTGRAGVATIVVLSVVESLLILFLVALLGLLLALLTTRGVTHIRVADHGQAPRWLQGRISQAPPGDLWFNDTGLTPVVAENTRRGSSPVHRILARGLGRVVAAVAPLRHNLGALAMLLAAALGTLLAVVLLGQWRRARIVDASGEAVSGLRRQVHRQIYRLGRSALPNEGIGPVMNLFTREVNDVRDALIADLDGFVRLPLLGVGLAAMALVLSLPVTIFLASLVIFCYLVARPVVRATRIQADAATREAALQLCLLQEDLGIVRTVRVYGMEAVDKDRFDAHLGAYQQADSRRARGESAVGPTLVLLAGIALILGLGLIGYAVLGRADSPTSLAAGLVIVIALAGIAWLIRRGNEIRGIIRRAERSGSTVFEYLDRKPELLMAPGAQFLAPLKDRITFENVTLEDPHGRAILSSLSTEMKAGSRVAILGLDEGAKRALACLIPRLIDPTVGRVRIDGTDLKDVTLESIRAQVATVFQSDLIFSDTVFANIGLGDPSYGLPRVVEAAKVAHVHHVIQELADGYDTIVGPLGQFLGIDEQYRIALARAWLHDPSIAIIEEPVAALEDDIKPLVDDTIDRLSQGRTLIFLPHRLSTIRKCDQVIVLNAGRIEDQGTPRDLQSRSKLFRHIQYVEFNQFATGEIEAGQMES